MLTPAWLYAVLFSVFHCLFCDIGVSVFRCADFGWHTFLIMEEKTMPDYKKMYYTLFNKITDVIEELKEVQCEVEELYIESCEEEDEDYVQEE